MRVGNNSLIKDQQRDGTKTVKTTTTNAKEVASTTTERSINSNSSTDGSGFISSPRSTRTSDTRLSATSNSDAWPLEGNSDSYDERRGEVSPLSAAGAAASAASAVASPASRIQQTILEKVEPEIHPQDPYLFMMPMQLHRYYQPLPITVRLISALLASWLAALSTWKRVAWWQPLLMFRGLLRAPPAVREVVAFVCKSLVWTFLAQAILQEGLTPPSRISTQDLLSRYFLPSSLSRYREIAVPPSSSMVTEEVPFTLGVHYLEYINNDWNDTDRRVDRERNDSNGMLPPRFDGVYFQHGFGASSLSWLPAIPSLVHRLRAKVGLGHDAVGFGFTDRPRDLKWYTSKQSARIAHQLLLDKLAARDKDDRAKTSGSIDVPGKSVALFGHSMGALAVLRLATILPKDTAKFVILSSPALGFHRRPRPSEKVLPLPVQKFRRIAVQPVASFVQRILLQPVFFYILRRVVGTKGSWKAGLKYAWGDKSRVTDSDELRFSWPAIGRGWEDGLVRFVEAQGIPQEDDLDDDAVLMRRVLDLPNTKVAVILGSEDRVVESKHVRKFMKQFPNVRIEELKGLGHDAFEEDIEKFGDTVDHLLASSNWDAEQSIV